jgi:hypothetical protein
MILATPTCMPSLAAITVPNVSVSQTDQSFYLPPHGMKHFFFHDSFNESSGTVLYITIGTISDLGKHYLS